MMNEQQVETLITKLNSGNSVDKECASILQHILDTQPDSPEAATKPVTAKSMSIAGPQDKEVALRFIELFRTVVRVDFNENNLKVIQDLAEKYNGFFFSPGNNVFVFESFEGAQSFLTACSGLGIPSKMNSI